MYKTIDRVILRVIKLIESRTYRGDGVNAYSALSLSITCYWLVMVSLLPMIWLSSDVPPVLTVVICLICNLVIFRVIYVCLCLWSRRALEITNMEGDLYTYCVYRLGIQSVQWGGTDKSLERVQKLLVSNGIDAALIREGETLLIEVEKTNQLLDKDTTYDSHQREVVNWGDWVVVTRSGALRRYSCPEYLSYLLDV